MLAMILTHHSMQTVQVESSVTDALNLLREIREHLSKNIQDVRAGVKEMHGAGQPPLARASFNLYMETSNFQDLVCENAAIQREWDKSSPVPSRGETEPDGQLFECMCSGTLGTGQPPHKKRLQAFSRELCSLLGWQCV